MNSNQKAIVYVRLKDGVLDPQGVTIHKALSQMGYEDFLSVRSGRFFELEIKGDAANIDRKIDEICSKLLANPVIEKYSVEKVK
ncbi:MAG: phosphoribosylformylglycinamidine synthase subunit PurS [Candidatus Zixiibacteriota bacterium]|nr:MAG: phosphoribosylformylglycinamidine synthase subunit PurS [candidate division Zixibacteria bacterium]